MLAHNVAALLQSPPGTARDIAIDESSPSFASDMQLLSSAQGGAQLIRTHRGILARGHVAGTVELECSRCLEPFPFPLSVRFEEEFLPSLGLPTGAHLPPPEDDALRIDERHVLDLSEIARQYLMTAIPIQPVCRPDCAGMCPSCGADLNAGECSCPSVGEATSFASLARLFNSGQGSEPPDR